MTNVNVELSAVELRIVTAALRLYRINRAAQGKLDAQRIRKADKSESDRIQRQYDTLTAATEALVTRLEASHG